MQDAATSLARIERLLGSYLRRLRDASEPHTPLDQPLTTLEVFKKAGEATAILAALFYVVGWSNLQAYYTAFGLNLSQLPISMLDGTTASLRVFFQDYVSLGILVAIPIVSAALQRSRLKVIQDPVALSLILIFLVAGGLSARARSLGAKDAWRDMVASTTQLPQARIDLDPKKLGENDVINQDRLLEGPYYVILLYTTDRIWAFEPIPDVKLTGSIAVVVIPKDAVRAVRLSQPTPPRKGANP